jgi:predicted transcriptional regulator
MKVMTARVVDGKIDVGDAELQDGTRVAVLVSDESEIELSEADQRDLEAALAEIERGELVDGRELLRELKSLGTR